MNARHLASVALLLALPACHFDFLSNRGERRYFEDPAMLERALGLEHRPTRTFFTIYLRNGLNERKADGFATFETREARDALLGERRWCASGKDCAPVVLDDRGIDARVLEALAPHRDEVGIPTKPEKLRGRGYVHGNVWPVGERSALFSVSQM